MCVGGGDSTFSFDSPNYFTTPSPRPQPFSRLVRVLLPLQIDGKKIRHHSSTPASPPAHPYTHRVASTPELVTKKFQVNEEDDDVNDRESHNLALLHCIRNQNKFPYILNLFPSEILVQKLWKSIVTCHFHTEMRRLVPRKYMAASQICRFVIARDMTIFKSVVQINPPSISAYVVSVVVY